MHFAYQGFTQQGAIRSFTFSGLEERQTEIVFSIDIDMPLLARYKLATQEAPGLCFQMLTSACAAGPSALEKFRHYQIAAEDLRPLMLDREKRAASKALRISSYRKFVRKPPNSSQLRRLPAAELR